MGIQGLLPLLKSIHKPCNLKKFAGQTIGVDAYGWLHRGTVACAMELAMDKPTRKFVDFAMHRVRMLQHFGVVPYLVFDGDYLPSKAATEADRSKRREESKRLGFELLNAGKTAQAYLELQKAVDVTPEMARQLIDELKKTGVQCIVAPYEADAQLVYLERKGLVSGIISEDSDLLVFGAKCLLTKLDQYGNCIEINRKDFCACREINLTGWSDTEFRQMAILSGCDYLNSINNMGLKTAYRMVRKHKNIEKVLRMLQFDGKFHVPSGYSEAFKQAELTFLHQWVYCPRANRLVFHTQPNQPIDVQEMPFIGAYVEPGVARKVAAGDLNPITKQPISVESHHIVTMPRTPWALSRQQPRRAATSDDLKKGVSIEQFFKPNRIPLAELDPNCFTPSPSQQNVLLRNPDSWASDPVPRTYLRRSNTEIQPQAPPPSASTTTSGRMLSRPGPLPETRPAKRTRLCSEDAILDTPEVIQKVELGRSRFFDSPIADLSPSVGRLTKPKGPKRDNIGIFSDDSIEEALLSLPDYDGWHKVEPKNKKTIAIFDEEANRVESKESLAVISPLVENDSQDGKTERISQSTVPGLTQSSSIMSLPDEQPTPVQSPSPHVFSGLKETFAFSPVVTPPIRRPLHTLAKPHSSARQSRIPRATKQPAPIIQAGVPSKSSTLTPLQSLGSIALNRSSRTPTTPPYTPLSNVSNNRTNLRRSQPLNSISAKSVPFPEVARPSVLMVVVDVEPATIPLPTPSEDEENALLLDPMLKASPDIIDAAVKSTSGRGSEDLIIHDSEEESDDDIPEPLKGSSETPKLSLEKFVFQQ